VVGVVPDHPKIRAAPGRGGVQASEGARAAGRRAWTPSRTGASSCRT